MGEPNYTELVVRGKNLSAQAFKDVETSLAALGLKVKQVDRTGGGSFGQMEGSLRKFDDVLQVAGGPNLSGLIQGIGQLEDAAAGTAGQLGTLAKAGLVASAALGGWQIGRKIAELTGSDALIGNAAAKLMGWGDAAAQAAAAGADVLARASKNAGRQITDMTEAVRINETATKQAMDVMARSQAPAAAAAMMATWRGELETLRSSGVLDSLRTDLDSMNFSQNVLADRYRVSSGALQLFTREAGEQRKKIDQATAAVKQHADAVEAMFRKYSGADATAQMKDLDVVFKRLASSGELTKDQIDAIVKEAVKLQSEGGKMTARLWAMVLATNALSPGLNKNAIDMGELGTQVAVVVPKLSAYEQALKDIAALPNPLAGKFDPKQGELGGIDIGLPDLEGMLKLVRATAAWETALRRIPDTLARAFQGGGSVKSALKDIALDMGDAFGQTMADAIASQLKKNMSAMSGSTMGSAIGMGIIAAGTSAASGGSTGQQLGSVVSAGASAAQMASMAGATTAASAALAAYTMGAGVAVIAAIKIYKAMNDGRKVMQDYYKTFQGGADELRQRMLILGDAGEKLWIQLTQKTGKGDKDAAKKITAEINAALRDAESVQAAISAAGFKSSDELKATADQAMKVWQTMKDSGKYSASQVAAAWDLAQEAIKAGLGDTAKAQQEAIDAITAKYADSINKLDSEYKSLSDSVGKEAEEEFMGIIETQERERMKQIEAEKKAQEAMRDAEIEAKKSTFDAIADAGAKTYQDLRDTFAQGLDIPYYFRPGNSLPGGSTSGGGGSTTSTSSGGGRSSQVVQLVLDKGGRKVIAQAVFEEAPGIFGGYGAARR